METLELKYADAKRALETLLEIQTQEYSIVVRDATIQRFEYTFEAVWKFLQNYLNEKEGLVVSSPKSVFREIFRLGLLTEEQTTLALEMTDKRNATSHTYKEAVAEQIYGMIKDYTGLMKEILGKIEL